MSQRKSEVVETEVFSEETVADYLRSHPDFFDRHASLLLRLRLPHRTSGAAVSLVERQVAMLRERNDKLERQLKDLVAVAKSNDALVEKLHQLSVRLISAPDWKTCVELLETSLRENFLAERAALIVFAERLRGVVSDGFIKVVERDDPALAPFSGFLKSGRPRCGSISDRQKALAFEREADSIASAALVPLGDEETLLGFLAIGNRDPGHFHPGKRMDFLSRLGGLVAAALQARLAGAANA